jgi:tRNA-modifying protein YgfZ
MTGPGFLQLPASIPFPPPSRIRVTGADAARYLNGQLSNDPANIPPGGRLPALLLTAKGKLVAPVFVSREDGAFQVEGPGSLRDDLLARLERYIVADDVTLHDETDGNGFWHVIGLAGAPPGSIACNRIGMPGFDCSTPQDGIPQWSGDEVEVFRIAHGVPVWGHELHGDTLPHEAGLDRTHVDFQKGCYVGQETVSRIQSVGRTNRVLVGLTGDFPPIPSDLAIAGTPVGRITSAARHLGLSKTLALAYVPRRRDSDTFEVVDASGQTTGSATIHEFPLL